MSKILEALGKLDPANENHWTADGLPRIETVRMLAGDQTITREQITAEAPDFSRSAAVVPGSEQPTPETPAVEQQDEVIDYSEAIEKAQAEVARLTEIKNEVEAALGKATKDLDDLIDLQNAEGPVETTDTAIQGYLASQRAVLEERARRNKVLADSGVTLADIQGLLPQSSPLDQALKQKRK